MHNICFGPTLTLSLSLCLQFLKEKKSSILKNSSTGTELQYISQKSPPVSNRKEPDEENMTHEINELEWPIVESADKWLKKWNEQQLMFYKQNIHKS